MPSTKVTNPYEFYISKNTSVSAEISVIMLNVTINQLAHQLITVTAGGKAYTSSFTIPYGTTYTVSVEADEGYTAGTVTPTSGTFTTDNVITATAPTVNSYTVTIIPGNHQTITVTNTTTGNSYTSTFTANYGDKLTATITADEGYTASTLNQTAATVNTSGATFKATADATINSYPVTINQTANQTITVNDGATDHTSSFSAPYGTKLTATITPDEGYTAGTLNQTTATVGTSGATFSATAATIQTRTITVEQPANGRIEVNGQVGTSFTFNYGTKVKIELKADTGYTPSALYIATED